MAPQSGKALSAVFVNVCRRCPARKRCGCGPARAEKPCMQNSMGDSKYTGSYSLMYYLVICLLARIVILSVMVSIRMSLAKINIDFLKKL